MSVVIYNNIASLTSQRYLGSTQTNMAKSLERLSSGLRINHASDDASGLAISEKLRGQISGLAQASANAQDGISMLQTGEGALQEVQNILQRMRELAVQASNGTYTSSDRAEIQKEVDQLKEEVDRISSSTEFNTKKLLNGDASALWSSNTDDISAVIRGTVDEGNYKITVTDIGLGKNEVYKTDVMTIDGLAAVEITSTDTMSAVKGINNIVGLSETGDNFSYGMEIQQASASATANAVAQTAVYKSTNSGAIGNVNSANVTNITSVTDSGYLEVEMLKTVNSANAAAVTDGMRVRFYNAETGTVSDWKTYSLDSDEKATISVGGVAADLTVLSGAGTVYAGDKVLLAVSRQEVAADANTVQLFGPNSGTAVTAQKGPEVHFTSAFTDSTQTFYVGSLNTSSGTVEFGSFDVTFESGVSTGQVSFKVIEGGIANSATQLKDVGTFVTDDGNSVFTTPQELKIYGNGTSATIYIDGEDTIEDLEEKLTDAIVEGLGMGANLDVVSSIANANSLNDNLVKFISPREQKDNSDRAVEGTFVIQTALLGADSQLSFVGDQDLIDGLSLATVQNYENSEYTLEVFDAHTGGTVGSDVVSNYTLSGVIEGVDVNLSGGLGVQASWDAANKEITFKDNHSGISTMNLHVVDNSTELQIGANEGQTFEASIAQIDTVSLGIDDIMLVDQEKAQNAITKIDKALGTVSSTRATIGAQINRLEYSISALDISRENLTASESRIRDLDVAAEMADFTRSQILSQTGAAMLSQANQMPQLALQLLG